MKLPLRIAVTGGVSSGKSTVCRIFQELGAYVVSADDIVHQLLSPHTAVGQKVIDLLGTEIILHDKLDRTRIAEKIFTNAQLLNSLETLMHPAVKQKFDQLYQKASQEVNISLFVMEIPLLFEAGGKNYIDYDYSIAVIANADTCRERFKKSRNQDDAQYEWRIKRQLSQDQKQKRADYTIFNTGTIEELYESVKNLFQIFTDKTKPQNA